MTLRQKSLLGLLVVVLGLLAIYLFENDSEGRKATHRRAGSSTPSDRPQISQGTDSQLTQGVSGAKRIPPRDDVKNPTAIDERQSGLDSRGPRDTSGQSRASGGLIILVRDPDRGLLLETFSVAAINNTDPGRLGLAGGGAEGGRRVVRIVATGSECRIPWLGTPLISIMVIPPESRPFLLETVASAPPGQEPRRLTLTLDSDGVGAVAGRVVDEQGEPVAGAVVRVNPEESESFEESIMPRRKADLFAHAGRRAEAGESGHFKVENLMPGDSCFASVSLDGQVLWKRASVKIEAGRTTQLGDIVLSTTFNMYVYVSYKGMPIPKFRLRIRPAHGENNSWITARTDGSGRAIFHLQETDAPITIRAASMSLFTDPRILKHVQDDMLMVRAITFFMSCATSLSHAVTPDEYRGQHIKIDMERAVDRLIHSHGADLRQQFRTAAITAQKGSSSPALENAAKDGALKDVFELALFFLSKS